MSERCQECGKTLFDSGLTHCSDKCLFEIVANAKSLSDVPIRFDIDSDPWL